MRVIRAERDIHVPLDPEKNDKYLMRSVQTGLLALVPDDFHLDPEVYTHVTNVKVEKNEKKKDKHA